MRNIKIILSILTVLVIAACSSENPDATFGPHPSDWLNSHAVEANADLDSCRSCHGSNFEGSGTITSCFACHASGPPFVIHPTSWTSTLNDHQTFFTTESWTTCSNAACHGTDLGGGDFGPSCFSADYAGASCHASGPPAPHVTPYQAGNVHGPDARSAQLECRNCHGRPTNIFDGGFVVDILGQTGASGGNCSTSGCHPEARAHPVNWQGTNDAGGYLSSHQGAFNGACALCHKTDGPGTGPLPPAPSCFSASYENSATSTGAIACHPGGPGVAHITGADWLLPSAHVAAWQANSPPCFDCHAVSTGGIDPTCRSCHTLDNPVTNSTGCDSCHGTPPSTGRHSDHNGGGFNCNDCHNGFGTNSLNHWYPDPTAPADTNVGPNNGTIVFIKDSGGNVQSCYNSCHGENHGNSPGRSW